MKRSILVAVSLAVILTGFLFATNPTSVPSIFLILPFLLLFALLYAVAGLYFRQREMSRKRRLRLTALIAGLPCLLLILQSVDQLTIRDAAMLIGFFGLASLYVVRTADGAPRE